MSSPQMRKWIYHRAKDILEELSDLPDSDDLDNKKLTIIRSGLRDASIELLSHCFPLSASHICLDRINSLNSYYLIPLTLN